MKQILIVLNATFLMLTASMYLGTGWSLWLFQFQSAPHMTIDNYYWTFVPQVQAASVFFTWMTSLMIVSLIIMIWVEWKTDMRWIAILVLLSLLAATGFTVWYIFPYNDTMESHITDPALLTATLDKWISLNRVRVILWTVEWAGMMWYFAKRAWQGLQAAPNQQ